MHENGKPHSWVYGHHVKSMLLTRAKARAHCATLQPGILAETKGLETEGQAPLISKTGVAIVCI